MVLYDVVYKVKNVSYLLPHYPPRSKHIMRLVGGSIGIQQTESVVAFAVSDIDITTNS